MIFLTVKVCISVAKNTMRKALNYQTDFSDWYQLYISFKINIEIPITYPTDMKPCYSCNHAEWVMSIIYVVKDMGKGFLTGMIIIFYLKLTVQTGCQIEDSSQRYF